EASRLGVGALPMCIPSLAAFAPSVLGRRAPRWGRRSRWRRAAGVPAGARVWTLIWLRLLVRRGVSSRGRLRPPARAGRRGIATLTGLRSRTLIGGAIGGRHRDRRRPHQAAQTPSQPPRL